MAPPSLPSRLCGISSALPHSATPIPWMPVILATLGLYNAVLHMTIIFPFIPQMLRTFHTKEEEIAWYAGFISAAYFLGAFFSSNLWGVVADVSGRRIVVILCTSFSAAAAVLFGFSKNFTWAVAARFVTGLSNGVLGTSKAIIGDVTDDSNQAAAVAFSAVGWSISLMTAPFIGGFLAEPVVKYPGMMRHLSDSCIKLLEDNPFLLPNLFAATINVVSVILFIWKLKETKPEKSATMDLCDDDSESTPLLPRAILRHKFCATLAHLTSRYFKFVVDLRSVITSSVLLLVIINAIFSYSLIGTDEITPVWMALLPTLGGLNFSTTDLAIITGSPAPIGILCYPIFIPWITAKLGAKLAFIISGVASVLTIIALPYSNMIEKTVSSRTKFWFILIPIWCINRMSAGVGFMSLAILINNSCLKRYLGTVNGLAASLSFLARTLSPIVCGAILTWSVREKRSFPLGHHLTFFALAFFVIGGIFLMTLVPDALKKQKTKTANDEIGEWKKGEIQMKNNFDIFEHEIKKNEK